MKNTTPSLFFIKNTLGSLEYQIMKTIWDNKTKVSVRDILNLQNKTLAYTTVMTVIDHLYRKGFLTREKIKKTYYYAPIKEKKYVVGFSLSGLFRELNHDYGKRKILYIVLSNAFIPRISIGISPYVVSVFYGFSISVLLFLLVFSGYNLFQNFNFIAIKDYYSLLISNAALFTGRLQLFVFAVIENIALSYLLGTVLSIFLIFFLLRKLSKVLDVRIFVVG